jgi:Zn-dependent metalloprotease
MSTNYLTGLFVLSVIIFSCLTIVPLASAEEVFGSASYVSDGIDAERVSRNPVTGSVSFIRGNYSAPLQIAPKQIRGAEEAARDFFSKHGSLFGIESQSKELMTMKSTRADGARSYTRFQQMHSGIPVLGGELIVQTDSKNNVITVNGETLKEISADTIPRITEDEALNEAIEWVSKDYVIDADVLYGKRMGLWFYNPLLLGGKENVTKLVWRFEILTSERIPLNELVLVDARTGKIALQFNQIDDALYRRIYDANNTYVKDLPGNITQLKRSEGVGPSNITEVDNVYDFAGDTYYFYFNLFGRDGIDGLGMNLTFTTRYCEKTVCPYVNAYWESNLEQIVFGDGFGSADDVVAHEMTHGVTVHESNLFYYMQSGAINEAFSDIFGEYVDQINGRGNDSNEAKWLMAEDSPLGAFRNMKNPPSFSDPDKMSSEYYVCGESDGGGVHSNSGVASKTAVLLTEGGSFNGYDIAGIGMNKTAALFYEAQTNILTSGSDYFDLFNALKQAAVNMDYSSEDRLELEKALSATEMSSQPKACMAKNAPICPEGQSPSLLFYDDMENVSSGNWAHDAIYGNDSWYYPQNPNIYGYDMTYATSGIYNIWGDDPDALSDSYIKMNYGVELPEDDISYLRFNHSYGFEHGSVDYDGGVLEYSTDAGKTWSDAYKLILDNGYNGVISDCCGNPLNNRKAFTGTSNGYISSRLTLASLKGRNATFRFRLGSDQNTGSYGWAIDDVMIYSCTGTATQRHSAPALYCNNSPCTAPSGLIGSRGNISNVSEPNYPNTIDSCMDGNMGTYLVDESLENMTLTDSLDDKYMAGDVIEASVWAYCYKKDQDNLNIVYANNSQSPDWRVISHMHCNDSGMQLFTANYTLDNVTGNHTIRGLIQNMGNELSTCGDGVNGYDDADDVTIKVIRNTRPSVYDIRCMNKTGWFDCSKMGYGQNITAVRAECTPLYGSITEARFTLTNEPDGGTYFDSTGYKSSGFWMYRTNGMVLTDSGNWTLTVTCKDGSGVYGRASYSWLVPWGRLEAYLLDKTIARNATKDEFFSYGSGVRCVVGECGNVTAILDPERTGEQIGSCNANIYSEHAIMQPDNETLKKWLASRTERSRAYIDPKIREELTESTGDYFSILSLLTYLPEERDQGHCGNCWAWTGTGLMDVALRVNEGVSDRLSIQYLNSNYNGGNGSDWACCGGELSYFTGFYQDKKTSIPWSNANASYGDVASSCSRYDSNVSAGSIAMRPAYAVPDIMDEYIETLNVSQEFAILNIKNVLKQNKAVWFAFYLPTTPAWQTFYDYWDNQTEEGVYNMDQFCGQNYTDGGGHAVLLLGYNDTDPLNRYWIILNSWGNSSERPNGLFRMNMSMNYSGLIYMDGKWTNAFEFGSINITYSLKGVIPMNNGTPFYTTDQNPVYPVNQTCLQNMHAGDECNQTWQVNATGDAQSSWKFFTFYESNNTGIEKTKTADVNITIRNPEIRPVISNLTVILVSENSATITWKNDVECVSEVLFGLNESYGSYYEDDRETTMHRINLRGLPEDTTIHYKVHVFGPNGSTSTSDKTFRTAKNYEERINANAGQTITLNVSGAHALLEMHANQSLENASMNVTYSIHSPVNRSLTVPGTDRYVKITESPEILENIGSFTLRMYYTDDDLLIKHLNETSLAMYGYNETAQEWIRLSAELDWVQETGSDAENNYVWANVTRFGAYAIGGQKICDHNGDYPACGVISLDEVLDYINLWAQEKAELTDVIALINGWVETSL